MLIELHPPLALHEQGQRDGNEDSIYPSIDKLGTIANSMFFLVCDGVGGAEKGEEASRIACETFAESLKWKENVMESDITNALLQTEQAFDTYLENHLEAKGMATTLTLVFFDSEGALLAHIGDSRIYYLRQGRILFQTTDHSLVNELIVNNIISAEDAASHPKRNVVSRAIMGSQRPTKADISHISDIQAGDYFFLCSDGILESVTDAQLAFILGENQFSEEDKLSQIFTLCQQNSRDNYSAYLLRVKTVTNENTPANTALSVENTGQGSQEKKNWITPFLTGLAILSVIALILTVAIIWKGGPDVVQSVPDIATEPTDTTVNMDTAVVPSSLTDTSKVKADSNLNTQPAKADDSTSTDTEEKILNSQ